MRFGRPLPTREQPPPPRHAGDHRTTGITMKLQPAPEPTAAARRTLFTLGSALGGPGGRRCSAAATRTLSSPRCETRQLAHTQARTPHAHAAGELQPTGPGRCPLLMRRPARAGACPPDSGHAPATHLTSSANPKAEYQKSSDQHLTRDAVPMNSEHRFCRPPLAEARVSPPIGGQDTARGDRWDGRGINDRGSARRQAREHRRDSPDCSRAGSVPPLRRHSDGRAGHSIATNFADPTDDMNTAVAVVNGVWVTPRDVGSWTYPVSGEPPCDWSC
jgi:hypothetical protein